MNKNKSLTIGLAFIIGLLASALCAVAFGSVLVPFGIATGWATLLVVNERDLAAPFLTNPFTRYWAHVASAAVLSGTAAGVAVADAFKICLRSQPIGLGLMHTILFVVVAVVAHYSATDLIKHPSDAAHA